MNPTKCYQRKPIRIYAWEWNGETDRSKFPKWVESKVIAVTRYQMVLETLEGSLTSFPGYYIIYGTEGEVYGCKPEAFHKKYELVPMEVPDAFPSV